MRPVTMARSCPLNRALPVESRAALAAICLLFVLGLLQSRIYVLPVVAANVPAASEGSLVLGSLSAADVLQAAVTADEVTEAREDYLTAVARLERSSALVDPKFELVTGVSLRPLEGEHAESISLQLANNGTLLGGTLSLSATSGARWDSSNGSSGSTLSLSYTRPLLTGSLGARRRELASRYSQLQAATEYEAVVKDLVLGSLSSFAELVQERNALMLKAVELQLAREDLRKTQVLYQHGRVAASSLAAARDELQTQARKYHEARLAYDETLYDLSRTVHRDILDPKVDSELEAISELVAGFLVEPPLGGDTPEADELYAALRRSLLLPRTELAALQEGYEKALPLLEDQDQLLQLSSVERARLDAAIAACDLEIARRDRRVELEVYAKVDWSDEPVRPGGSPQGTTVGAEAVVPLYDAQRRDELYDLERAAARKERQATKMPAEVTASLERLKGVVESADWLYEDRRDALNDARQIWGVACERLDKGLAPRTDVAQAVLSLLKAEADLAAAGLEKSLARCRYLAEAGLLTKTLGMDPAK